MVKGLYIESKKDFAKPISFNLAIFRSISKYFPTKTRKYMNILKNIL